MIYTVTMNPSIDYVVEIGEVELGKTNRSTSESKFPGGKGINVSRVLNNLGVKSIAMGFVGGFTGRYIVESLKGEGIESDFVQIGQDTRINVKLKGQSETEINASGPFVTECELQELMEKLKEMDADDYLILAGNVQPSIPFDIYSKIQKLCCKNGVKTVLDTSGQALKRGVEDGAFLIKPNIHELEELVGEEVKDEGDILSHAMKLVEKGSQNVIVSMAEKGAYLVNEGGAYFANAPAGQVQNSVGAGDSMIAGFIYAHSRKMDIEECFRYAASSGSATAFSMDLCKEDKVKELYDQINVRKIR